MGQPPQSEITDLHAAPGELSFEARIGGVSKRVWFRTRTEAEFVPPADAALAACLMPAMRFGGRLRMEDPVSPRLLRTQCEFQDVQRAWSGQWEYGDPRLRMVGVRAPVREAVAPRSPTGRVAAFFSGGVDSWATVLENPDLTDLVFVRGLDLMPGISHPVELVERVERRLNEAAAEVNLPLHVVETNLRELSDPLVSWETFFGCALAAVGLFLAPLFDRVLIAGDNDYEVQVPFGANRFVDQLLSTEELEIADDGGRLSRMQRVERIAPDPLVQRSLRVCWENLDDEYNCGRCRKCLMTMAAIEITGHLPAFTVFPQPLDLEALSRFSLNQPYSLGLWEDIREAAAQASMLELEASLAAVIDRRWRDLGDLPISLRKRVRPNQAPPPPTAGQEIADLRAVPGELSFEARIGGESKRIWFRTETDIVPPADAALVACLMPAMNSGGTLSMSAPVSPRLLRTQREFQAAQAAWSRRWKERKRPLVEVEVQAPIRAWKPRPPTGRVAILFSAGVDSFAGVLQNPDLTDLIFVRGLDLPAGAGELAALADEAELRAREAADALGLQLHVVATNIRELSDPLLRWETYFACPLAAIALFFEPLFDRVLIAGDVDHETQLLLDYGAIWTVDQLLSTELTEIVDWGGLINREERLRLVADSEVGRRTLRVCWENPDGAYNCGRCRKCMAVKISLEALGIRDRVPGFGPDLDLGLLDSVAITEILHLVLWEDLLETTRTARRPDLEQAVAAFIARGKDTLALPQSFRTRESRTEKAGAHRRQPGQGQQLLARPETASAIAEADSLAILVGGYDGSGNFGDIAQVQAALALLEPLSPRLLAVPVIELGAAERHDLIAQEVGLDAGVLYFDPEGSGREGLMPVAPLSRLGLGACYLYGGGYLNQLWGRRKLEMLAAGEALLAPAATEVVRVATGLQIDPPWFADMAASDRRALRTFDLLGARDPSSVAALEALEANGEPLASADDAVAVLPGPRAWAGLEVDRPLIVDVQLSENSWVTEAHSLSSFFATVLARLGELGGRAVQVRPQIAFLDEHTDERPGLERLAEACSTRGISLDQPRLRRRPEAQDDVAEADLTLSCSYHVALASLLRGTPAALLADNPYYAQKAAGLREGFELPAEFAIRSSDDPDEVASQIANLVLDPEEAPRLRARLLARAQLQRRCRASAEAAVLARLAAGALAIASADNGGAAEALDGARHRAEAAERSAAAAHAQLGQLLESRSWRLTAPLRNAWALARQRIAAAKAVRARR